MPTTASQIPAVHLWFDRDFLWQFRHETGVTIKTIDAQTFKVVKRLTDDEMDAILESVDTDGVLEFLGFEDATDGLINLGFTGIN